MSQRTRFLLVVALIAAMPLVLLADSSVAVLKGWNPQSRLEVAGIALAILVITLLTVGMSLPRCRRWLHIYGSRMVLSMAMTVFALVIAETVLQRFFGGKLSPAFHTRPADLRMTFHPLKGIMPGVHGDSRFTINSRGIRGPELPLQRADLRILCVGGSTTECAYLDDLETWPHLLMQGLNRDEPKMAAWVGNIGISGYNTRHHLKFVRESPLLDEVDCLLLLVGVNDFLRDIQTDRPAWNDQPAHLAPIWSRSVLLQLIRYSRLRYQVMQAEDFAGQNYALRRRERQQSVIVDELPELTAKLAEFQQRIQAIIDVSRSRGMLLVFLTQPTLWDEKLSPEARDLLWMGSLGNGKSLSANKLQEGMRLYNEKLLSTCRDVDVTCLNLDSMNGNLDYFYDACHFSEQGARQVASLAVPVVNQYLQAHWRSPTMAGMGRHSTESSRGDE